MTPASVKTTSSSRSLGQPMPKNSLPATTTMAICRNALVTAFAPIADR